MTLDEIKEYTKHDEPQKQGLFTAVLNRVYADLELLKAHGHYFHVEPIPEKLAMLQFPTMLYKDGMVSMEVNSSEELASALAAGWKSHPGGVLPVVPKAPTRPRPVVVPPAPVYSFTLRDAVGQIGASPSSPLDMQDKPTNG